jgi:hypothetical protein
MSAALAGGAMLLLAACGGGDTVTAENASVAEVAEKVKNADIAGESFISPGRWEMTMDIREIDIPGMPPEMKQHMQSAMGQGRSFATCVTPEEAKRPKEDFFAGQDAPNCRYDNFAMGNGSIDLAMTCKEEQGTRKMLMKGSYGDDAYTMDMDMSGQGEGGAMTMKATMTGKRVGECKGDELG